MECNSGKDFLQVIVGPEHENGIANDIPCTYDALMAYSGSIRVDLAPYMARSRTMKEYTPLDLEICKDMRLNFYIGVLSIKNWYRNPRKSERKSEVFFSKFELGRNGPVQNDFSKKFSK